MTLHPPAMSLAETLGLKPGMRCWFPNMPAAVRAAIAPEAMRVDEQPSASDGLHCAFLFATDRNKLARDLAALSTLLSRNGAVWIAWPAAEPGLSAAIVGEIASGLGFSASGSCQLPAGWSALQWIRPPAKSLA